MNANSPASNSNTAPARSRVPLAWQWTEQLLLATWLLDAALVMNHYRVPFLTSHAADLTLPAWLYVMARRRRHTALPWQRPLFSLPPLMLAVLIFAGSTATEISQYFWPAGWFRGVFDPLDILAYAGGIGVCWLAERRWPIPAPTENVPPKE